MEPTRSETQEQVLATQLVAWYKASHRKLPWRETSDPYALWISEIMLQQTQVATVLPYYHRFLEKFPTIQALAEAPLADLLKVWEGLGYYARARNIHKAAQQMLELHSGQFPSDFESILALPGIGQSTAGAILTFAFKQPHPILDGNVKRVLSRLYAVEEAQDDKQTIARLWDYSKALLPSDVEDAYYFNQAVMELGATLCVPKEPQCKQCPWVQSCEALKQDLQNELPLKIARPKSPHYTIGVGVVWKDEKLLIALRPEEGLLGGLWEFPGGKCKPDESLSECVTREILEETGLTIRVNAKIATVKHAYTHFKITLHAFQCDYISGEAKPKASQEIRWIALDEIETYAFPKANKMVIEALKAHPGKQLLLC